MADKVKRTLRDVRDKLLSNPVSPRVEAPADINLHYCRYVAETVEEELSEDMDIEILEDGGQGYAHTWVRSHGRNYDAECIDGVEDYRNLPFFQRHPEAANRVVPATVDPAALRNRNRGALYPVFLSPDSTGAEGADGVPYWCHAIAGVLIGVLLLVIGLAGEWAIEAQILRDTAFLYTMFYDIEILGKLIALLTPIVFFLLLPATPDPMPR